MFQGVLVAIYIASDQGLPVQQVPEARAVPGKGLEGDRYFSGQGFFSDYPGTGREITLIEIEAIEALEIKGIALEPGAARRNLVTRDVPLNHLVGRKFRVGEVYLQGMRLCEPCEHLEELTRKGVLKELIHRGGLRADILRGGIVRRGDAIVGGEIGKENMIPPSIEKEKVAMPGLIWVSTDAAIESVRELFLEYAESLGFSLCFQGFDKELAELPGMYAPPQGRLLLATIDGTPAGCAALHAVEPGICEMKRLYVRPQWRGSGLGRKLAEKIIAEARTIGYSSMRLDTIAGKMDSAIRLYRELGFSEIAPYRPNPIHGALYMELQL